jgi:hypothetical protein
MKKIHLKSQCFKKDFGDFGGVVLRSYNHLLFHRPKRRV